MKKKFFNKLSLTLCLVSCAAIVFWPNSAGAAISGATSSPSLLAGTNVLRPDGVAVKLPKKWEEMTIDDLYAIGIYPNIKGSNLKSSYTSSNGIVPASSSGCNGWVCINIIGSGLLINNWSTSGDYSGFSYFCTYSVYWKSQTTILDTGTLVCGYHGRYFGNLTYPVMYPHFGWACNTWVGIPGKPCEQIIG